MLQTHDKFMKYVLFTLHRMTPEQMKMNPIKPVNKVKTNEELDKEERESIKDEEESTETSQELSKEQNLHLIYILNIKKIQNQLKHLKFLMF